MFTLYIVYISEENSHCSVRKHNKESNSLLQPWIAAFNSSQLRMVCPVFLQCLHDKRCMLFMTIGSLLSDSLLMQSDKLSNWLVVLALFIRYCRRNLLLASRPDSVKLLRPLLPFSSINSAPCPKTACELGVSSIQGIDVT